MVDNILIIGARSSGFRFVRFEVYACSATIKRPKYANGMFTDANGHLSLVFLKMRLR